MSNFEAFNHIYVNDTLNLFDVEGLSGFTPIRYEALTPDRFVWLFRADFRGETNQFFVIYQDDSISSIEHLKQTVSTWSHSSIKTFIKPAEPLEDTAFANFSSLDAVDEDIRTYAAKMGHYLTFIAHIETPVEDSYWANVVSLEPGDDIENSIAPIKKLESRDEVRKTIYKIIKENTKNKADQQIPEGAHISFYHDKNRDTYDYFFDFDKKDEK